MAAEDDDKPKGSNISKLSIDSPEDHSVAAGQGKQVAKKQTGSRAMQASLQGIGGLRGIEHATKALGPFSEIQERFNTTFGVGLFGQNTAQQKAMHSLLPDIKGHLSAMSGVSDLIDQNSAMKDAIASISALPESWANIYGLSATARLAEEMRERHVLYLQPASAFADLHKGVLADVNESIRALALPQFGTLEALGVDRIANAFSHVDVFTSLGMASVLDDNMRSITTRLSEHLSGISGASTLTESIRATFPVDVFGAIEGLLARSLEAQEELLEEHRASEADAKKEASFHRRMATLMAVISILMFLLTVAMQAEDRLSDDDEAVRANTRAINEMRDSFDAMAVQIERMQATQEKANEAEQAADAALVDILRDIAETLETQTEPVESEKKKK